MDLPAAAPLQVEAEFLGPFWEYLKWCRRNHCGGTFLDGEKAVFFLPDFFGEKLVCIFLFILVEIVIFFQG